MPSPPTTTNASGAARYRAPGGGEQLLPVRLLQGRHVVAERAHRVDDGEADVLPLPRRCCRVDGDDESRALHRASRVMP